ncbi:N-6 DNA methylase [Bacillus sp. REN16]|uniref:N-6 DNA methylase n=1 Tax=Bacillus sp. REN16 TaxID=2887296 RepID=UPI001E51EC29|nr:N-6 DNA methylase [Bacillus sp. REN16]MCC3359454.1 N-6 DNA methylase [Bacillus sp. REN16]
MKKGDVVMNKSVSSVWRAVDLMRGSMDVTVQKRIIASLILLKAADNHLENVYLPPQAKWSEIIYQGQPMKDKILSAFYELENKNENLKGVLLFPELKNIDDETFQRLIPLINQIDISQEILGEILFSFASEEGKIGGEFITPKSLSDLLPALLDIKGGDIYDGTAGVAQLLIEAGKYASQYNGKYHLWGQEINENTWALGKINLMISNIDHKVKLGDTLSEPAFVNEGKLRTFDYVVMNFPFSLKGWGREKAEYDLYRRFLYGIPSEANADMAFVQHALASLNVKGKAAVIVTHGTLFRGGADRKIREAFINEDIIEAVIGLPANLFYSTNISAAILILNKNKSPERKGKIQFINAENDYERIRGQNALRKEDKEKILHAYHNMEQIKQFSTIVAIDDIEEGNLHFGPYFEVDEVDSIFGPVQVNRKIYEKSNIEQVELSELVEMFRGMNTPPKKDLERQGDYFLIQLADIQDGNILFNQLTPVDLDSKKARNYEVEEGDLILSSRGATIKIAVVPQSDKRLILSQNFIGLRPRNGVNSYFIKAFLESPIGTYYISSKQKGTAVAVLSVKDIESIPVPKIDKNTQDNLGEMFVSADEELIRTINKAREKYIDSYYKLYEQMGLHKAFKEVDDTN